MLLSVLRGGADFSKIILNLLVSVFVVFCTMPIHEFAHAFAAHLLGDDTAKNRGRLTLSPLAHVNWIGALMILLVGVGYAEPVPVNPRNFKCKNRKAGMVAVSLAGPASNLIMAVILSFFENVCVYLFKAGTINYNFAQALCTFFYLAAFINTTLAVFNLLPIPPLDGSSLLTAFLPAKYQIKLIQYQRYILIGLMVLAFTGILSYPLSFLSEIIMSGIEFVTRLPFGL